MSKKLGPLKTWQWAVFVGGGLGLYLLYHKKSATKEEEPLIVGGNPLAGGNPGEGGLGGLVPPIGSNPIAGEPGPVGAPGPAGPPGTPGPAELSPEQEASIAKKAAALNNPPTSKSRKAPKPIKHRPPKGRPKNVVSKLKKGHAESHSQARKERRGRPHAPKAEHLVKHAAAVAPRQHGKPAPLHVARPNAPHAVVTPKAKPSPVKPAKRRRK